MSETPTQAEREFFLTDGFRRPMPAEHSQTHRALSIQQPWAWLIVNEFKDVENRDWPTRVRGLIEIHAGKKFDHAGYNYVQRAFPQIVLPHYRDYDLGGIVGRARLIDCVTAHDSPWFTGTYGFVFADAEPLPFRACRGMLGLFTPSPVRP